ncbi:MAG: MotA/TolQ/ExbB proton channel family protein [Bryobacteraceae bacterium]
MTLSHVGSLVLDVNILELVNTAGLVPKVVMGVLAAFSLASWAIIFSKWSLFRQARDANRQFLRAFRKAPGLEAVALASEQFRSSPLVAVFDFGYGEVDRQVKARGTVANKVALERSLQLGVSEELTKLERSMNWLATTASVCPFIGLFGTVWGIIDAFQQLGLSASVSLRAVGPGIADALVATALGLAAAIPAAIFYNHYGHSIKEFGARMDDFCMEFLNMAERDFED